MSTLMIYRQVGNPDFECVVLAELLTMCFVSYNITNTVAKVHNCKLSQKNIAQRLPGLESLCTKKGFVTCEVLLTINGAKYSTFQESARVECL
ncbi:hypothetical protein TNCV_2546201 [Trichonephila clavipes]|nr:hypothetical protein TNCV_2546201 [Trichonephila clavipes]